MINNIMLDAGKTTIVLTKGTHIGMRDSNIGRYVYNIYLPTPTINWTEGSSTFSIYNPYTPPPGLVSKIMYTLDGTIPTKSNGIVYLDEPVALSVGTTVVKAIAYIDNANYPLCSLDIDTLTIELLEMPLYIGVNPNRFTFSCNVGNPSVEQSSRLTGEYLEDDITITAPAGYEISDAEALMYASEIMVPSDYDDLIYIRLIGDEAGTYNSDLLITSPGITVSIALNGEVLLPAPVMAGPVLLNRQGFVANWSQESVVDNYLFTLAEDDTFLSAVPGYDELSVLDLTLEINGLDPGAVYYYKVVAVSGDKRSIDSNIVMATPQYWDLTITSSPAAAIWRDGVSLGVDTPHTFSEGMEGEYLLVLDEYVWSPLTIDVPLLYENTTIDFVGTYAPPSLELGTLVVPPAGMLYEEEVEASLVSGFTATGSALTEDPAPTTIGIDKQVSALTEDPAPTTIGINIVTPVVAP